MPSEPTQYDAIVPEDEIDLRELFGTIWRYKRFIILFTMIVTLVVGVIAYRMPKYYQTTTSIEVKSIASGGLGLASLAGGAGAAGALLGLGAGGGEADKVKTLLSSFRTTNDVFDRPMFGSTAEGISDMSTAILPRRTASKKSTSDSVPQNTSSVPNQISPTRHAPISSQGIVEKLSKNNPTVAPAITYAAQYFVRDTFRNVEILESNSTVIVQDLHIPDYKKFGMKILWKAIDAHHFNLKAFGIFFDEDLGTFSYGHTVQTPYFSARFVKTEGQVHPRYILLNGDRHYQYKKIIHPNLTVDQEKLSPFINIRYDDTLPDRGNMFVQQLVASYRQQSIQDEIEDLDKQLATVDQELRDFQKEANSSARRFKHYKSTNQLIAPEAQAEVIITQVAEIESALTKNLQKIETLKRLIRQAKRDKALEAISPILGSLGDTITVSLIAKIQSLQITESQLTQEFTSAYPKLRTVRGQMRSLRLKVRNNLANLLTAFRAERTQLKKQKAKYTADLKNAPRYETELASITRDYKLNEKIYTYLLQKRAGIIMKKTEALSKIKIIEPIYTDPAPAKPKKLLILIVGFITALILSIFIVFFREFLRGEEEQS
jgi:uncharacterized protein involved in exopolysaccharide biosynthesis